LTLPEAVPVATPVVAEPPPAPPPPPPTTQPAQPQAPVGVVPF
jgi:hypothetical protein